jgi:aspartate racemase
VTSAEFLAGLRRLGIEVRADGTSVRCSAPEGVLTASLQEQISTRRAEILALLQEESAAPSREQLTLRPLPRTGDIPLSFSQRRLWFLEQLEPGTPAYTLAARRLLRGPLDPGAVSMALSALVRRHESLRTTFADRHGEPVQRIANPGTVTPPIITLDHVPAAEQERAAEDALREAAQQPFDLTRGPLFRPMLLRFGHGELELAVSLHHIIADGWSLSIIAREVAILYEACVAGTSSPLPDLPIQYADFALWQRQRLTGSALAAEQQYWHERLSGRGAPLELRPDYPRPLEQRFEAASHDIELPVPLSDALRELGRREGTTLFMTLLAGFNALLCRYTGQEDIVIGAPVASRTRVELESVVGFFANTLVLRTDVSGDPTFRELLARVREVSLGAYAHQDMPFDKVVEALQPERQLGRNPLFEISFVFQVDGGSGSDFAFVSVASPFDLTLFVQGRNDGALRATIQYKRNLFAPDTIARLARHYRLLLEGVAADPDRRLSEAPLLDETERRQLLHEFNATATDYPRERSIHSLFREQAAAAPDAVAVVFDGASHTYRELDRRSNQLAHFLATMGLGTEQLVGVWMERSLDMVVALLGILKAGGAYAAFDRLAPPERLATMIREAAITTVLTHDRIVDGLPSVSGVRTISIDALGPSIATQPDTPLVESGTAESLAYVMFTSGSTGAPKGVAATHRNVVRLVKGVDYASFGPGEVFLQLAPLSFDASTFEIWGPLLNGGRLAVAPPGVLSVDELGTVIRRDGVTTLWLTAGLFHQVVDQRIEILRPLRQLLAGGDVLSVSHVARVLAELPTCRLVNGYGPTEGTTFSCCHPMLHAERFGLSVPIGRPIANTRAYVLDRRLRPVPIGVPGELWIAGDGLARGYVNRPELTSERFVVHRLSASLEERLYRSGDVVRWLSGGVLEFIGRVDDQVKIRGYRVEPGEIETTLARLPQVREAAVVARPGQRGDKSLIAYVVSTGELSAREIREFLRDKVPEYMIPHAFVFLERLPLTPSGKVDRRMLPEPVTEPRVAPVAPRDEVERQLVAIWQDILERDTIHVADNFFDLGGHSLLAVRMFAQIEDRFGKRFPLATLFQAPTLENLAAVIRAGEGSEASWRPLIPIRTEGNRPPIFAVPGVGGNVLSYTDLARFLASEQPLYALQSRGLSGDEKPYTRIEDIAAAFVAEIRGLRPLGPYILLGACMGGVVAFEMAQQLRSTGQEVALLVMIETWPPPAPAARPRMPPSARTRAALQLIHTRVRMYAEELAQLRGRQRLDFLRGRLKRLATSIVRGDVFHRNRGEYYLRLVTESNLIAFQRYEPRTYAGRAVLFCAEGRTVSPDADGRLRWRELITGGLDIYYAPGGDSGRMLVEPDVSVLAEQLNACIERVQPSAAVCA